VHHPQNGVEGPRNIYLTDYFIEMNLSRLDFLFQPSFFIDEIKRKRKNLQAMDMSGAEILFDLHGGRFAYSVSFRFCIS